MASAETVILRAENQLTGPADAATGALGRLEAQAQRETAALGRLEQKLTEAKAKLSAMAEGSVDARAVAAFEKQGSAVGALEAKLDTARQKLALLAEGSDGTANVAAYQRQSAAISGLDAKLDEARVKMQALQGATDPSVNVAAYKRQQDAVAALGDKAAAQKDKIAALGDKSRGVVPSMASASGAAKDMGKNLDKLKEASGANESRLVKLGSAFLRMGPEVAIAAAAIAVAVAALVVLGAVIVKGISDADKLRSEFLKLQGALKGSASAATDVESAITAVSGSTALARDKVTEYGQQLAETGLQGAQLKTALDAMAIAGSAGGEKVATAFLASVKGAQAAGESVDALAATMKAQLGGVAAAQAIGLDAQMLKLHENIATLFSGANVEPFLRGMHSVLGIFDANTAAGKAMRESISTMVNAAIGAMLRLAIAVVNSYIAIKTNAVAWGIVKATLLSVAVATLVVVAAIGLLIVGAAMLVALFMMPLIAVVAVIMLVAAAWDYVRDGAVAAWASVTDAIGAAVAWLQGVSLSDIGTQMIEGLVSGIMSAGPKILASLSGLVTGAVDGVKGILGIHSPSRVFADQVGYQMGAGVAVGVDDSSGEVQAATGAMAAGAVGAATPAGGSASAPAGGSFSFVNCVFGGDLTEDKLREWMTRIMLGELASGGATT